MPDQELGLPDWFKSDKLTFANHDDQLAHLLAEPQPIGLMGKARFDHSTGLWHIWNGILWEPDKTDAIYEEVRQCFAAWLSSPNITAEKVKIMSAILNTAKKRSVLEALAAWPGIAMSGEEWDQHPFLMGFKNGVLDLQTLTLDPEPDPDLLISRSTHVDWNPDPEQARDFVAFVQDIMGGDPDMTDYVLRVLGYSMLATNREQKFWMWVGGGQNGKGVLARVAAKALGDYAATPPDTLYMRTRFGSASSDKPRPELLKLQGARFTYMSEPQGGQFNEEMLKAHSGNDFIEARTLHSKTFKTFQPTHKIVFLTNNPPRTDDVGPSMQRRVRIVWFEQDYRDPTRNDPELEDRLKTPSNLEGALFVMATAAKEYLTLGLPEPQKVIDWSAAYIAENDPISSFLSDMCVEDQAASESSGLLWKAFDGWCDKNGYEKMSQTGFGLAMSRRYQKKARVSGNFYLGVRLKNIADRAEENAPAAEAVEA